jgi:hypothetical protein
MAPARTGDGVQGRAKAKTEPELIHDALIRIVDRITPPKQWTQRAVARNASGQPESYNARQAVCWCLNGAMLVETSGPNAMLAGRVYRYLNDAADALYPDESGYVAVNDYLGHDAALAVARRARDAAAPTSTEPVQ